MIPIQVCQEYMVNGTEIRPQFLQLTLGTSHGEPQVDQDLAGCAMLLSMEQRAVATGTAAEVHQVESWTSLSFRFVQYPLRACFRCGPRQMPRSEDSMNSTYSATTGSSILDRRTSIAPFRDRRSL